MFRDIRYQTGEIPAIIKELRNNNIPCVDVDDYDDFNFFIDLLLKEGLILNRAIPFDRAARNPLKEPEFEFRATFNFSGNNINYFIDFYFEPLIDRDYAPIGGD